MSNYYYVEEYFDEQIFVRVLRQSTDFIRQHRTPITHGPFKTLAAMEQWITLNRSSNSNNYEKTTCN